MWKTVLIIKLPLSNFRRKNPINLYPMSMRA